MPPPIKYGVAVLLLVLEAVVVGTLTICPFGPF
jgi:hypothetical protein